MTEKQTQILNTAAMLFSKYGYKKTTIDEIVAGAGISKGLFYHYYADKKQLYLELYSRYTEIMDRRVRESIDVEETDFFERLKQISHIRISFINEYPNLWAFLYAAYYEQHPDVADLIREKNKKFLEESYVGAAKNIDWSSLKAGISKEQALQAVIWIAEGFVNQLNAQKLEFDENRYGEFDLYLDLLRDGMEEKDAIL